ncbi:8594_t:CDS:2, partial [Racocetra fulgida]
IMDEIIRVDIVCRRAGAPSNKSAGLRKTKSIASAYTQSLIDNIIALFDPGYHKLSHSKNDQVQMLYNNGVPVPTIIQMLSEEYGRYIHNKDVYNTLNRHSRDRIKGLSQVAELLNNLHNKKEHIITYSINNNRLHCLFFTTHPALLMFNGVDVMGITYLIASVLLANETTLTFHWALQQLKQVAGDEVINKIRTVVTDRDLAILPVISNELPHNHLLEEYPEANKYMKQWKSISHMWAHCYTNKNVNYGIRTTQRSEDSNAYLKRLLGHTVPLPELVNMLEKLSRHQLEQSQYQQYRLRGSTRQHCPKLLKNVSMVIADFTYSLLIDQYNKVASYSVQKQNANLFKVFNEYHNNSNSLLDVPVLSSSNYQAYENPITQQLTHKSTADLLKEVEAIANRVGHVKINNTLALFVNILNKQYPLKQADIGDSINIKAKGRPSNTKHNKM